MNVITIPQKLSQKGDLIIVPRREYEEALEIRRRLLREEKDTDDAVRVFEKERKAGRLKKASGFAEMLR